MNQQNNKVIVVVGEKAVGKSAIVHRLIEESFDFGTYKPTVDDCFNIVWKLPDGKYLQIQLIDTAAWNEFPAMQSLYIKMAHLVMVVFDVTSPEWRDSLLTVINGVRNVKSDADIFVVGNKSDKLTKDAPFTPTLLSTVIGHSCVGHVITSALNQQGIVGLKQLILCSKSQLTEGHYTEFSQIPKRKKLRKKLNGLALALNFNRKDKEKAKSPPKYREQVVYPEEPHYIQYNDLTQNNFDKLFDAASHEELGHMKDSTPMGKYQKNKNRVTKSNPLDDHSRQRRMSTCDYSSGVSQSEYEYLAANARRGPRKSVDISAMMMNNAQKSPLNRKKSTSHSTGMNSRNLYQYSSSSTLTSESSGDSVGYNKSSPPTTGSAHHLHAHMKLSIPEDDQPRRMSMSNLERPPRPDVLRVRHQRKGSTPNAGLDLDIDQLTSKSAFRRPSSTQTIHNTLPSPVETNNNDFYGSGDLLNNLKKLSLHAEEHLSSGVERARRKKGIIYHHSRHKSDGQLLHEVPDRRISMQH